MPPPWRPSPVRSISRRRRLLDLCQLYDGDGQHIAIPVTQEMLASLAGTTRPTANQVLGRLAASRLVEVSRGQIVVLNRRELRRRAGHPGQA